MITIQTGIRIQAGETYQWPSDPEGSITSLRLGRVPDDGSRLVQMFSINLDEGYSSEVIGTWVVDSNVVPDGAVGCLVLPLIAGLGDQHEVRQGPGRYIPYFPLGSTEALVAGTEPVNAVPYVLRWKHHLAKIADDFVSNPLTDVFSLLHRDDGVAPDEVGHSTLERQAFEFTSVIVRRLVGLLWNRVDAIDTGEPAGDAWKTEIRTMQGYIDLLCASCSGRAWKRELITKLKTWSWGVVHGVDAGAVHFPTRSEGLWIPGSELPNVTAAEHKGWLAGWSKALDYHHGTEGNEADLYFDAPLPTVPAPTS